MDGGIHLHQLAEAGAAGTTTAMGLATTLPLPQPFGDQPAAERLGANVQAVLGQFLAGEGGSEVGVVLAVGSQDGLAKLGVGLVVGRLAAESVDDGGIAAGLQPSQDASDLSGAVIEQACRFGLRAIAA
jgi:hypothetical protein